MNRTIIYFLSYLLISGCLFSSQLKIGENKEEFSEFYLKKLYSLSPRSKLKRLFKEAVKNFDTLNSHTAFRRFNEITDMAYFYDWDKLDRKSIAYSFLRLAEQNWDEREFYVNEAKKFAKHDELHTGSFEAKLIDLFKTKNESLLSFPVYHFFSSPKYVLLNSRRIDISNNNQILLPKGKLRLSIISKNSVPFHYVGTRENFLSTEFQVKALDLGNCSQPKLAHYSLKNSEFTVSYSKQCHLSYSKGVYQRVKFDLLPKNKTQLESGLTNYQNIKSDLINKTSKSKIKTTSWKKVLYWTTGAIALGLIYENNKKRGTKLEIYK